MLYDPLSEPEKLDILITIEDITQDRKFAGGESVKNFFEKGSQNYAEKRYKEAVDDFEKAKQHCPEDAQDELWAIHYNAALAFEKLGDLKRCVTEFEKAHQLFGNDSLVVNQIYRVCLKIDEPDYVEKGKGYRTIFHML